MMKVLVACEFSGVVREAFRSRGHDAWSCDYLASEQPGQPYQGSVYNMLYGNRAQPWDLMIAFPPCTYLAVSGARWFRRRAHQQGLAVDFVRGLLAAPVPRIALENPVGVISTRIRKPDEIIQPWQFGQEETKRTCLWLKNLPMLTPTQIMSRRDRNLTPSGQNKLGPGPERWKDRSRTYPGIAEAMAEQWG